MKPSREAKLARRRHRKAKAHRTRVKETLELGMSRIVRRMKDENVPVTQLQSVSVHPDKQGRLRPYAKIVMPRSTHLVRAVRVEQQRQGIEAQRKRWATLGYRLRFALPGRSA